ncbi:CPCC family cysteine-rich protein [Citrobacter sp. Cb041]|uniref:CPCC family cysteine-rich protein n=1 Tax=Citrobacter sp. Cb041 TaxID=2985028 RepID=UPI00336A7CD0
MMELVHSCPCCGQYEFPEEGSYEICPVCTWEDDPIQTEEPDYKGGANVMSLNEAREAFRQGRKVS